MTDYKPDHDNWTDYLTQPAPPTLLCQFRRRDGVYEWKFVAYARDFLPEFNVAGLEWRLTGIAREELAGMSDAARAQVMPSPRQFQFAMLTPVGMTAADKRFRGMFSIIN